MTKILSIRATGIIVLVLASLSVGVWMTSRATEIESSATGVLRVAFPYAKSASSYEPALIHLGPEYVFLENVFSPLVEMSPRTGQIEAGVAKSYRWEGNELRLSIRSDLKTVSGIPITALDAEFSLKRLLTMPGNTHGNFRELLCGHKDLQSIEQNCEGIRVEGNELILRTTDAGKTFLLPMLVTIDFAIIPRSSVDPKTLKIVDFRNTTGPFYVAKDSDSGEIELRANPNHYHYSVSMPQVVQLVPSDTTKPFGSLKDFREGKVDFITTIDQARADEVIQFSREVSNSVLHTTMNIRSFILTFTKRGMAELSREERLTIGSRLRKVIWTNLAGKDGYERSTQFFPSFGEGALDKASIDRVEDLSKDMTEIKGAPLRLAMVRLGDTTKFVDSIKEALPQVDPYVSPKNPNFMKFNSVEEEPHLILSGPDTGFQEDIGLITYSLNAGYFGMDAEGRRKWLEHYMSVAEKAERLRLLKELHEKVLSEPVQIPLLVAPYAALSRKPWKINLSQLYANNQLWLLQAN